MAPVIRCPYCALGYEFKLMRNMPNGTYLCDRCGHMTCPDDETFTCSCRKCFAMRHRGATPSSRPRGKIVPPQLELEKASSVKITERTYEEGTEAFHTRRKSSHLEAASCGQSTRLGAV